MARSRVATRPNQPCFDRLQEGGLARSCSISAAGVCTRTIDRARAGRVLGVPWTGTRLGHTAAAGRIPCAKRPRHTSDNEQHVQGKSANGTRRVSKTSAKISPYLSSAWGRW